jgi:hypothetical protein
MLLIGVAPGLTESSSQGIRVVTARDLLNYAEMPAFREALLDRIKHTENGISWGMGVNKKNLYCTPPNLPLAPEQILTITRLKRSSRSCGRSTLWSRRARTSLTRSARSA